MADKHCTCKLCQTEFTSDRKRMYCSPYCRERVHTLKKKPHAGFKGPNTEPPRDRSRVCMGCNKHYINKRGGGQGDKYCSRECAYANIKDWFVRSRSPCSHKSKNINKPRQYSTGMYCEIYCTTCVSCLSRFTARSVRTSQCRTCATRRTGSHKVRASYYKVPYEKIDRGAVFDMAGWQCQLCGIDTPKEYLGNRKYSLRPNAPQLDHIFPISRGGPHLYTNVQLLCRGCNMRKHDKI